MMRDTEWRWVDGVSWVEADLRGLRPTRRARWWPYGGRHYDDCQERRTRGGVLSTDERVARLLRTRKSWLFDLDGTLIDSASIHEAAFRDALVELAPQLLHRFHYQGGASTLEAMSALTGDVTLARRLSERKQQLYLEAAAAQKIRPISGSEDLLDVLDTARRGVYLVTSGSRRAVNAVLELLGLTRYFAAIVTSEEVVRNKPAPDIYEEACRRWSLDKNEVIVIEDSANGARAALAAGLTTLQVNSATVEPGALPLRSLRMAHSLLVGGSDA